MSDWHAEPRPVPVELDNPSVHATYPPARTVFATVADQLDAATVAQLMEMARGGIGEPVMTEGEGT